MLRNLLDGLTALGNVQAVAYLVAGSLIGMFLGVIPGLGGAVILSVVLAFIYHISIDGTLALFLAVQAGSYFSASVTSILLNTPAHPEAFAVTFDGFPMAQRGEAGRALGISATSTCLGGLIGCAVLVGFIQIINYLPTVFHPPEYVALIVIAMLLVGTLGTDAISKAIASAGLGLVVASIGVSTVTGVQRYIFSNVDLEGGISLVALVLGLFAIPQMTLVFGTASTIARQDMTGREVVASAPVSLGKGFGKQVVAGMLETLSHWVQVIRGALIGVVTGIIPGIGGFAANFLSYGVAQQSSKHRELFGTGIPEGIIAPESSSLSKEAGGMVPLIALGIPGGVGSALFLAALTIKGIKVGYGFAQNYPVLPYEMVWVIALGGFIGTLAGVLSAPFLARVTRVPGPCLLPFIMTTVVVGTFVSEVAFFCVVETIVFAIIGLALRRLRYSIASFAVGLVLGPTLETNIYLTHTIFPGFTFLTKRPLADALFALAIFILVLKTIQMRREARLARQPSGGLNAIEVGNEQVAQSRPVRQISPYPLLDLIVSVGIAAFGISFTVYGLIHYNFTTVIMPASAGGIAGAAGLWRIPFSVIGYVRYRAEKRKAKLLAPRASHTNEVADARELVTVGVGGISLNGAGASEETTPEELPTARRPLPPIVEKCWGWHGQYTREVVALGWFGSLMALAYLFGFDIGVPTFAAFYGLFATRRVFPRLRSRCFFAAGAAGTTWAAAYFCIGILHIVFTPVILWPIWITVLVTFGVAAVVWVTQEAVVRQRASSFLLRPATHDGDPGVTGGGQSAVQTSHESGA